MKWWKYRQSRFSTRKLKDQEFTHVILPNSYGNSVNVSMGVAKFNGKIEVIDDSSDLERVSQSRPYTR